MFSNKKNSLLFLCQLSFPTAGTGYSSDYLRIRIRGSGISPTMRIRNTAGVEGGRGGHEEKDAVHRGQEGPKNIF